MENIIFCGGCGTFISANEISAGKASKINNIYYCQKCSTGTQSAPVRPASAPPAQTRPLQARPAAIPLSPNTNLAQPGGRQPVPTVRSTTVPAQPRPNPAAPISRRAVPAIPASKPQTPVQAQKPPIPRPAVPAAQLNDTVPINQPTRPSSPPTKGMTKPTPPQKVAPPQPPVRSAQTSRLRSRHGTDNEGGVEELDIQSSRRFGKAKTAPGGIKKIYLIAGAAGAVLIIAILVITSISNASKEKAKEARFQTQKQAYNFIVEAENDYPNEPQKVIDEIKKRADALKGTEYEKKVTEMEQNAKARIEIIAKIKELEKPVDTAEEVEKRIKEISATKSNPAVNKSIEDKLRDLLTQFTKQKRKLVDEENKAREGREAAEKKAYEDFKTKIETLRNQKSWKEMLRECDILLGRPNTLQYQEEVDKIKDEAKEALAEQQEKSKKRKEWQVLNDDISKWERAGDSKSEIYVDEENKIVLKNPNSSSNSGSVTSITNNNDKENWKDFTMTVEFKVLSGSFKMFLRGGYQPITIPGYGTFNAFGGIQIPFPRKFKDEWQKYTIELKGKKLTISGSGLTEPKTTDVPEAAGGIGINVNGGDNIIVKELKAKVIE